MNTDLPYPMKHAKNPLSARMKGIQKPTEKDLKIMKYLEEQRKTMIRIMERYDHVNPMPLLEFNSMSSAILIKALT